MGWLRRTSRVETDAETQQIEPPTEPELEWVKANLELAKDLVAAHTGSRPENVPDPSALDETYAAWFEDWGRIPEGEREDPNVFINAFGLALGQNLVDTLQLTWVVVTDSKGTEIAVHGRPGDILVFPPNLVAKRFERGETQFLQPVCEGISTRVRELRDG